MHKPEYRRGWLMFRVFRILGAVSFGGTLAAMFLYSPLLPISAAVFILSVTYTTFWRCPSCGKLFCTGMIGYFHSNLPISNYCIHCDFEP